MKALNECVHERSGSSEDGDALMTSVFSEKWPKLRLNRLRTDGDRSEQRGHMTMCQAVVAAWRNPRAHSSSFEDTPANALHDARAHPAPDARYRSATRNSYEKAEVACAAPDHTPRGCLASIVHPMQPGTFSW